MVERRMEKMVRKASIDCNRFDSDSGKKSLPESQARLIIETIDPQFLF